LIKAKVRRTNYYSDGTDYLEIHIKKSGIEGLPCIVGERVEVTFMANGNCSLAGLRMTEANEYVWICPDVRINNKKSRLSEFLLHINAIANSEVFLEYRNEKLHIYNSEEVKQSISTSFEEEPLIEGAKQRVTVNKYERNVEAKIKCIEKYGTTCVVCGFNSEDIYGVEAKNIIHVHHLVPLAQMNGNYIVDPEKDLRPVCPNCHAVIHRNGKCDSVENVRNMLNNSNV
jgi:predicted HNH restriction endonuclease